MKVHALAALCNQADVRTFHIVRYHQAWFEDDGTLYIQTELCSSTLRDEMDRMHNKPSVINNTLTPKTNLDVIDAPRRFKCLREVLLALQLVHSKNMVHLDIKPDNIFVQNGLYKLGDFGLAGISTSMDVEEGDSRYMSKDILDEGQRDLTKVCCHLSVFCPNAMSLIVSNIGFLFIPQCDIFSLGATMYELCLGRTLPSCGEGWHDIRNGKLIPFWPPGLYSMIRKMMDPDPAKRPSASELLSHEELSCRNGQTVKGSTYNVCLKETMSSLKRSSSWT